MAKEDNNASGLGIVPEWIAKDATDIHAHLTKAGIQNFDKFCVSLNKLHELISQLPREVSVFELYKITPRDLMSIFPDPFIALTHACEGLTFRWAYQHAYKTSAMLDGFMHGLESGNFLLTVSCGRSILEEAAHVHYFLNKNEVSYQEVIKIVDRELPRFKKGKPPTEQWKRDVFAAQMQTIQRTVKSLEGSDFDWNGLVNEIMQTDGRGAYDELLQRDTIRKTHINDCIESLESKGRNAKHIYGLLSEMVHPNFGSNTLVVKTRHRINDVSGNVVLSGHPKNAEAAAWFFEILAVPLCTVFDIETDCIFRSQNLGRGYQHLAESLLPSGTQKSGKIRFPQ